MSCRLGDGRSWELGAGSGEGLGAGSWELGGAGSWERARAGSWGGGSEKPMEDADDYRRVKLTLLGAETSWGLG